MQEPEDVAVMLRLHEKGWGSKRIARELGVSRNTVRRYLRAGGYAPYGGREGRRKQLAGLDGWIREQFHRHRGNADVVRQELERVHGIRVSLRTVERAVEGERRRLRAEAVATVRFETPPGRQLQADFGQISPEIAGERTKIYLCVLTLGYSRRLYAEAFEHERLHAWLTAMENAFRHFGGIPQEVLIDNARALVTRHDVRTREVVFSRTFSAFARYWGFTPKACAPYRARTKGKDERGVGYVKNNAIAGRAFASFQALQEHLRGWLREVADVRRHGTTAERPIDRFLAAEAAALRPLAGKPPFHHSRELTRRVHNDLCVEVDGNHYSVPWRYIGEEVLVHVSETTVVISHAGAEVATHARLSGRTRRSVRPEHFGELRLRESSLPAAGGRESGAELLRPLAAYEAVTGGSW
jgi:transposase